MEAGWSLQEVSHVKVCAYVCVCVCTKWEDISGKAAGQKVKRAETSATAYRQRGRARVAAAVAVEEDGCHELLLLLLLITATGKAWDV